MTSQLVDVLPHMREYSSATCSPSCHGRSGGSRPDGNRQKKPRRPHNTAGEGKDLVLMKFYKTFVKNTELKCN